MAIGNSDDWRAIPHPLESVEACKEFFLVWLFCLYSLPCWGYFPIVSCYYYEIPRLPYCPRMLKRFEERTSLNSNRMPRRAASASKPEEGLRKKHCRLWWWYCQHLFRPTSLSGRDKAVGSFFKELRVEMTLLRHECCLVLLVVNWCNSYQGGAVYCRKLQFLRGWFCICVFLGRKGDR